MRGLRAMAVVGGVFLVARAASAHDSWLVATGAAGETPRLFGEPGWESVTAAILAFLAVVALVFIDRRRKQGPPLMIVTAIANWTPTAVGIAASVVMLAAALERTLFAPNLPIPDGAFGTWAVGAEILAAVLIGIGLFARFGALLMLALFATAIAWGRGAALDSLVIPGMAFFILVWGRGRLSLGSVFGRIFYAMDSEHARPVATTAMRILAGATLVALAVGKFMRPDLHFALLESSPDSNPYLHISRLMPFLSREWYLYAFVLLEAGTGLLIAAGAMIRPVALLAVVALLVSPLLYGSAEFMNHLPLVAALLALVALGRDKTD